MIGRAACLLFLAVVPGVLAGSAAAPGVDRASILIGGTAPLSGRASPAAAVSKGAAAYFAYVNARGGVNGRKIEYRVLDDGSDPARTVEAARRLVLEDHVFAMFNTLGTSTSLAIRDFLNRAGVPQLFVAGGSAAWGRDGRRYPWTIGYVPSYRIEGFALARQVLKAKPKARIAVLYSDDEDGRDLLAGFGHGLAATGGRIAKAVGYDPAGGDIDSQVSALRRTGANTLTIFAFGTDAAQALIRAASLGWRPRVYLNAAASAAGVMWRADLGGAKPVTRNAVSVVFFKEPSDPRWADDPGIALFRTIVKRYAGARDLRNGTYVAGMAAAFTLVDALKRAGRNLTRTGIMAAVRSLNEANNPFVLPGIEIKTGPADPYPIEQLALERWSGSHWSIFTGPLTIG